MMVNYYRYDRNFIAHNEDLHTHRRNNDAYYALMDFDQSIILPSDTCLKNCRRPSSESRNGSCAYKPWDTDLGEPYYNPFAYDVGMLGNVFRWHLAVSTRRLLSLQQELFTIATVRRRLHRWYQRALLCSTR